MIGLHPGRRLDERLGFASAGRKALAKVFPDHWSFMLGEIAMYSFMILVGTGVYLAMFFDDTSTPRLYLGSYAPEHGQRISGAYASSVELSWDVRGGLLMRQAHHWAAHVFIGAIVLHLLRIYFTGMFRRPRELNWTVGVTLFALAIFNAFAGYSLPDDLLSGTGLRIFASVMESVPIVGAWMTFLVFGGEFPGHDIIERLYVLHVFVVPAAIAGLIGVHMLIVIRQKHSHFAGRGRRDSNVVGSRVWPAYALRSMGLLSAVTALVLLLGGLAQINPIWVWGDYEPWTILSPSVADWYILWVEGALRLFPPIEFSVFGHLVPNQFWPGAFLPALVFAILYLWPWIDRRLTGDRAPHHIAASPRESPVRVAIGVAALFFFAVLLAAGSEELWVQWLEWPIAVVRNTLRVLVLALPVVGGLTAWWVTRALLRSGHEKGLQLGRQDLVPFSRRREPGPDDLEPGDVDEAATAEAVEPPGPVEAVRRRP